MRARGCACARACVTGCRERNGHRGWVDDGARGALPPEPVPVLPVLLFAPVRSDVENGPGIPTQSRGVPAEGARAFPPPPRPPPRTRRAGPDPLRSRRCHPTLGVLP